MKKFLAGMLAAALVLGTAACGTTDTPKTDGQEQTAGGEEGAIIIGGMAPLTGGVAVYGNTATNGAKLAFKEINAAGGVLGRQVEYRVMDEKGDPVEAVNAYNKLSSEGVVAMIGDITSKPSSAVAQAAAEENMPLITPTATAPDVTTYGANVFRVCYLDPTQGKTMADYAADTLGAKTAAVMYNTSDDYSDGIATAFKAEAEAKGMTVTAYEGYGASDVDFKTQLTKIAGTNPDVLLIPDYYKTISLIASQAKDAGITATLLGGDGWDGIVATVDSGNLDIIENSYFCNHYSAMDESEKVQKFIAAYKAEYNEEPSAFSALAYDAAYIVAGAIETAGSTDKQAIVDAIAATEYDGVTGNMTFDADGNPVKSLSIIKIVDGQYTLDSIVAPEGTAAQ